MRATTIGAACLVAGVSASAQEAPTMRIDAEVSASAQEAPTMRIDAEVSVRLQQLYVTVTSGERRVLDLERGDFEIVDGSAPQEVVTFERGDVPFAAVLLVDCSVSMTERKLATAVEGARAFLSGMQELDEASVVFFSDRLLQLAPFPTSPALLASTLGPREPVGGTALNDHLYLALKMLEQRQGRRAVVVLSDGVDVDSALSMSEVLEKARESQAIVYWLRPPERSGVALERRAIRHRASVWRDGEAHVREIEHLGQAVRESGGRIVPVLLSDDLRPAFTEVLAELREQYVLGYYPSALRHDGRWRPVEVRLRRSGLTARSRGYLDL